MNTFAKSFLILFLFSLVLSAANANPTKVGNGDAGGDLEKMDKIQSGILISTRDKAIELLKKQNVQNIAGLSKLIAELEKADIYLSQNNVSPVLDTDNQGEISKDGRFVYARTFAEPHAPVRFFPAAMMLSEEQLINLHIHEALHRALPQAINQSEAAVSEITLALTSTDANIDRTQAVVDKHLKNSAKPSNEVYASAESFQSTTKLAPPPTAKLLNPSTFSYSYTGYQLTKQDKSSFPINGMHEIKSLLYPFGESSSVQGIGIRFSYLNLEKKSFMGPLAVSANSLFSTWRGFEIDGFAEAALYTLSNEELKNLPKTRDTLTIGVSMKKSSPLFYTENFVSIIPGSQKKFKVGNVNYSEEYSAVLDTRIEAGIKIEQISMGIFGDFLLTDGSKIKSDDSLFINEPERIRAFKIGPRISYAKDNFQIQAYSQHLVDKTPGYTLSDFGNLMGLGAGTSNVGGSLIFNY